MDSGTYIRKNTDHWKHIYHMKLRNSLYLLITPHRWTTLPVNILLILSTFCFRQFWVRAPKIWEALMRLKINYIYCDVARRRSALGASRDVTREGEASQPGTSGTLIGSWHTTCQGVKRAPLEFLAHSIGRLEASRKKRKKEEWRAQESQSWLSLIHI